MNNNYANHNNRESISVSVVCFFRLNFSVKEKKNKR